MKKLFFSLFLIVSALPTMNAQNSASPAALRVEILVFSGRPNPVFTLTDPAQIDNILATAEALPSSQAASSTATERPTLGYTGIRVTNLSVNRASIQDMQVGRAGVRINRKPAALGKAAAARVNPPEVRNDATGALETQLLALARDHGAIDDHLLARLKKAK
ncbi:MAG: hypothetical protein QM715_17855 [Nibricoccus sp.]